jgi:hypothetical protein
LIKGALLLTFLESKPSASFEEEEEEEEGVEKACNE